MDKKTIKRIQEKLGPRPNMPEGWEDAPETTWRHGACFMWDKIMKLLEDEISS